MISVRICGESAPRAEPGGGISADRKQEILRNRYDIVTAGINHLWMTEVPYCADPSDLFAEAAQEARRILAELDPSL